MFELPELLNLARQLDEAVVGQRVRDGSLGNKPHKFVWYDRDPDEFARLVVARRIGPASASGRWLFVPLEPAYVLLLGECGGRLLLHEPGAPRPATYHLWLAFDDGSSLTLTTAMWGAIELREAATVMERPSLKGMRPTPIDDSFSFEYFLGLVDEAAREKRSAKGLLTQDQLIPGLGNASAQDILHHAGLHPRHPVSDLDAEQRHRLYDAIVVTVSEIIDGGGRNDEVDLYGNPGRYVRRMDRHAVGRPCPACGISVQKIQYLGGACYVCPGCQS